jgi:hypothetical protein
MGRNGQVEERPQLQIGEQVRGRMGGGGKGRRSVLDERGGGGSLDVRKGRMHHAEEGRGRGSEIQSRSAVWWGKMYNYAMLVI